MTNVLDVNFTTRGAAKLFGALVLLIVLGLVAWGVVQYARRKIPALGAITNGQLPATSSHSNAPPAVRAAMAGRN